MTPGPLTLSGRPNPFYDPDESDPTPERIALGHLIRSIREARGLSRAEVARRCNIGPEPISRIEHGSRLTSLIVLARLATAMKWTNAEWVAVGRALERVATDVLIRGR